MLGETRKVLTAEGGVLRWRCPLATDVAVTLESEQRSAAWLRAAVADPVARATLRRAVAEILPHADLWRWSEGDVTAAAARALARGMLCAVHTAPLTGRLVGAPEPIEVAAQASKKHWIEFSVEYPSGDPVSGLDYVLVAPSSTRQAAKLPGSGRIRKDGIEQGTWTLELKDVENAQWRTTTASPGDRVALTANVSGYADGTPARVRLFEELREKAEQALVTLDAKVLQNKVQLDYVVDDTIDALKGRQGAIALIAEVSIGDGWAKTVVPLDVSLKSIERIAWQTMTAAAGDEAALQIWTTGFADDAEVEIELFERTYGAAPESLGALEATALHDGVWEARFEWDGAPEDHGPGGHALFAKVRVAAGGIERTAQSGDLSLAW